MEKLMKKQVKAALLMALAATILPACGKSKNAAENINTSGYNFTYNGGVPTGGTFTVSGQVSFSGGGSMFGTLSQSNTALPGGNVYTHTSTAQDQVRLVLNGSSAYAQISVAQGTASWFQMYCGSMPTALTFSYTILNAPQAGQFATGIRLINNSGCGINI